MYKRLLLALLVVVGIGSLEAEAQAPEKMEKPSSVAMTLDRLEAILREVAGDLRGGNGQWQFTFDGVTLALFTSVRHDRMRIIAPITRDENVSDDQRKKMLEANFHTALDARYATSNAIVYAAYIHPLSPLREDEFRSALRQVAQLARSFGTTYSSGELRFMGPGQRY